MKSIQRSISCLLVFCMVISMLPATAWAEETIPSETEVEVYTATAATTEVIESSETSATTATEPAESFAEEEPTEGYSEADEDDTQPETTESTIVEEDNIVASGTCEDTLTWVLDGAGILTISGNGEMKKSSSHSPWYQYRENISAVVLEDGITSIGNYAFEKCNLKSIVIPDSVINIGYGAFYFCEYLTEITLPSQLTCIESSTFQGCLRLQKIVIPSNVTNIKFSAFSGCSLLSNLSIPSGVTNIGHSAFAFCYSLADIVIPEGIVTIGHHTFNRCTGLRSVVIPEGVTTIEDDAFWGCDNLESVQIPSSVTSLGNEVFYNCANLCSIEIPSAVTNVGYGIFTGCSNLEEIIVDPANECFTVDDRSVLYDKGMTKLLLVPGGVVGCYDIPLGVTAINHWAFASCEKLTSVTIPVSVESIGARAFEDCSNLTQITFWGDFPALLNEFDVNNSEENELFYGITTDVFYPENIDTWSEDVLQDYGGTVVWKSFKPEIGEVKKLTMHTLPNKVSYIVGDKLDLSGIKLLAVDTDGNAALIAPASGMEIVSGDTSETGKRTVTVAFQGLEVEYDIIVHSGFVGEVFQPRCEYPESEHYSDCIDESFTYKTPGADYLKLTFSRRTYVDPDTDMIFLYNVEGDTIGIYSGDSLAGQTIIVDGDTVTIHIVAGLCGGVYGFSLKSIFAYVPVHNAKDSGEYFAATCTEDAYTIYTCEICGVKYKDWKKGTATHICEEGFCIVCGLPEGVKNCGDITEAVQWMLSEDFCLTITGEGEIPDEKMPWIEYVDSITRVIISEGISYVGSTVFMEMPELSSVAIPDTVTCIGDYAFCDCSNLMEVNYSGTKSEWEEISIGTDNEDLLNAEIHCEKSDTHDHMYTSVVTEPNCTQDGYTTYTCVCGDSYVGDETDALGHTEVTDAAVAPTCTEAGLTEGKHCSICGEVLIAQETIEATGHNFVAKVCTICGELDALAYGTCGEDLTWVLDHDGILTISGTGEMDSYSISETPWYDYENNVVAVILENTVTSIGDYAFNNCSNLLSVAIPDGVVSVGMGAFYNCKSLVEIVIPDSVASLGVVAFSGCENLKSVVLSAEIESIETETFEGCVSLAVIEIPEGIVSIGEEAFGECTSLETVSMPSTIKTVGYYAFDNCTNLKTVHIDDLAAWCSIEFAHAYSNPVCYAGSITVGEWQVLTLDIPDSVSTVNDFAFYNCSALSNVKIPVSVVNIGMSAFAHCSNLTDVYYSGTESEWSEISIAEYNDTLLNAQIHFASSEEHKHYYDAVVTKPTCTTGGYTTYTCACGESYVADKTEAQGHSFGEWYQVSAPTTISVGEERRDCQNCDAYESRESYLGGKCGIYSTWKLLDGVLTINGSGSLYNYGAEAAPWYPYRHEIVSVSIENGITTICAFAFEHCSSLITITIPESVTRIGIGAFEHCSSLIRISLPNGVASIEDMTFYGCTALLEVAIPESITSIGDHAFWECSTLTEIMIPEGATSIGYASFYRCTNLHSINIPNSMTSIGDHAFRECSSLAEVTIPEGITSIGQSTFSGCTNLSRVSIPESITSIGDHAFRECSSLTEVTIPEGITSIGQSTFWGCTKLSRVSIPESITSIGDHAFRECSSLTEIVIPEGTTSIGYASFYRCTSLRSIYIPQSMADIGDHAIRECYSLKDVYYSGNAEEWAKVSIGKYNHSLSGAIIHYNSFESKPDTVKLYTTVGYFADWNEEKQIAYFDDNTIFGYQVSEKMEPSVLENIGSMVGQYVLIEYEHHADCLDSLLNIQLVESRTGVVTEKDTASITIDGINYVFEEDLIMFMIDIGTSVRYYLFENELVAIDILETVEDIQLNTREISVLCYTNENDAEDPKESFVLTSGVIATVEMSNSFCSDEQGKVTLQGQLPDRVTFSKEGYESRTFAISELLASNAVYLQKQSDAPVIYSLWMDNTDILHEEITIHYASDEKISLVPEVDWGESGIGSLSLYQGVNFISITDDINTIQLASIFDTTKDIYLVAANKNGDVAKKILKIKSIGSDSWDGFSFKFSDKLSFTLPESAGILAGKKLSIGIFNSVPVEVVQEDGKVYVAIGYQTENTVDENGKAKVRKFSESAKTLCKNVSGISNEIEKYKACRDAMAAWKSGLACLEGSLGVDGNFTLMAFAEGYLDENNELILTDSGGIMMFSASLEYSQNFLAGPVPVVIEVGFSGKLQSQLNLFVNNKIKEFTPDVIINSEVAAKLGVGVGLAKVASVIFGGKGRLYDTAHLSGGEISYYRLNGALDLYLKLKVVIASFEWSQTIKDAVWYEYPKPGANAAALGQSADEGGGKPDFYDASQYTIDNLDPLSCNSVFSSGTTGNSPFVANAYEGADPQTAAFSDGTKLAVWIGYNDYYSDSDGLNLYYSYYNGSWSQPMVVEDDGTMDAYPDLKVINDTAYLVWQDASGSISNNATLEGIANIMDISGAVFDRDAACFSSSAITSGSGVLNLQPKLCGDNAAVYVVWHRNSQNDWFGQNYANSLLCSHFTGTGWTDPYALYSGLGPIMDFDAACSNGSCLVAYSMDGDCDLNTTEDVEVYQNGSAMTDNTYLDSGVCFSGTDLYWYSNGILLRNGQNTMPDGAYISSDRFQIIDENGIHAVVYAEEDGLASVLYAAYYDASCDEWGAPVVLYSAGTSISAFSASASGDGEVSVLIQSQEVIEDFEGTDPYGTVDLIWYNAPLGCNIRVNDVRYDNEYYIANNSMPVFLSVKNTGEIAVQKLLVEFLDSDGTAVQTRTINQRLLSGEEKEVETWYQVGDVVQDQKLLVKVTPVGTDEEKIEDNTAEIILGWNDLAVEDTKWGRLPDGDVVIHANIVNRGYETQDSVVVSLISNTPSGDVIGTVTLDELAPFSSMNISFAIAGKLERTYYVTVEHNESDQNFGNNSDYVVIDSDMFFIHDGSANTTIPLTYIMLYEGQTTSLYVGTSPDDLRRNVDWYVEEGGQEIVSVDEAGRITGLSSGTAYILAEVSTGETILTARCRVDVTEQIHIDGVQLSTNKLNIELFSTHYANLDLLLMLPQNYSASVSTMYADQSNTLSKDKTENNGVAIEDAYFADVETAKYFSLVVLDDRRLDVRPTAEAVQNPNLVDTSYCSSITIVIQGQEYTTDEVKISVKKTIPKLEASIGTFNSFYSYQSHAISFSGAVITKISQDPDKENAIPEWLFFDNGYLVLNENASQKTVSEKVYLSVETEEWVIPTKVVLNAKCSYKAPGLKLSASSIQLAGANSDGVKLQLQSKDKKLTLNDLGVDGISAPDGYSISNYNAEDGTFVIKAESGFQPGKINLAVSFQNTAETVAIPLTVKVTPVTLKLAPNSITLNSGTGDSAAVTVTATPADYRLTAPDIRILDAEKQDKTDSGELKLTYENGRLSISTTDLTPDNAKYTLYISAEGGKEAALKISTTNAEPTLKLKANGNLDLSFPDRKIGLITTFKNHSGGNLKAIDYTVTESSGKTVLDEDSKAIRLTKEGADLFVQLKDTTGINIKNTFTLNLKLTLEDDSILESSVKIPVKQTNISLKLSANKLTLNKAIDDKASVTVTCATKDYSFTEPVWTLLDSKGKEVEDGILNISWSEGKLTVATTEATPYGGSYKLQISPEKGAKAVTLAAVIPAENKSTVTGTLKATGNLDVIRDGTALTVTPTWKNCNDAERTETLTIRNGSGEDVTANFSITEEDGKYILTRGAHLDHTQKYTATLTATFANGTTAMATGALKLKMGSAKLTLKADSTTLFANDKHSRVSISFASADSTLNKVAKVELDPKQENQFEIFDYGNGQYAIGFKDGNVPAKLTSANIPLNVWLEGNETAKANANLKVKISIVR